MSYSSVKMWSKAYCILGAAFLAALCFQTAVATSRALAKAEKDGTAHIFSASRSLLQIGLVPGFPSLGPPISGNIGPPTIGFAPPTIPSLEPPTIGNIAPPTIGIAPPTIPSLAPPTIGNIEPPTTGIAPPALPTTPSIPSVVPSPLGLQPPPTAGTLPSSPVIPSIQPTPVFPLPPSNIPPPVGAH
eukprot:Gb_23897 [translate_table: standard]